MQIFFRELSFVSAAHWPIETGRSPHWHDPAKGLTGYRAIAILLRGHCESSRSCGILERGWSNLTTWTRAACRGWSPACLASQPGRCIRCTSSSRDTLRWGGWEVCAVLKCRYISSPAEEEFHQTCTALLQARMAGLSNCLEMVYMYVVAYMLHNVRKGHVEHGGVFTANSIEKYPF